MWCLFGGNFNCLRLLIILGFEVVVLLQFGCKQNSQLKFTGSNTAIKVQVFQPLKTESITETIKYFGVVQANRKQTLGFTTGGQVKDLPVRNQSFAANSIIAQQDSTQLVEQRDLIAERISATPESLAQTPQTQQLRQQLESLDAQVEQNIIRAPYDCVIQSVLVSENSLVAANRPVLTIVEQTLPDISIQLPSRIAKRINSNTEYNFILDGKVIQAKLKNRAFEEVTPGSIEVLFKVSSDLSSFNFSFGETIEARFEFATDQEGYWIPIGALKKSSQGLWAVYVVDKDQVQLRMVELAMFREDVALVTTDLENTFLIREGTHRVVVGQHVEPVIADENVTNPDSRVLQ